MKPWEKDYSQEGSADQKPWEKSYDDVPTAPPVAEVVDKPSSLESFLRGGAQGLTFDFADEIGAGAESLVSDKPYRELLDEYRAAFDSAREANPGAYIAGDVTGAVAPALATGGASLLGLGARPVGKMAAKSLGKRALAEGALTGAGVSEAQDVAGLAKDIAIGGTIGAVAPTALRTTGKAASKVGRKAMEIAEDTPFLEDLVKAAKYASEGRTVVGKKALEESTERSRELAKSLTESVKKQEQIAGKKIGKSIEMADRAFKKKNYNEYLNQLERSLDEINVPTTKGKESITELKDLLQTYKSMIPQGKEGTKTVEAFGPLGIQQLDDLKKQVGEIAKAAEKTSVSSKVAAQARSEIDKIQKNAMGEVDPRLINQLEVANKQYGDAQQIRELLPDLDKGLKGEIGLADAFRRSTDDTTAGIKQIDTMDEVFDRLTTENPEIIERMRQGIAAEADIVELARKSKRLGFDPTGVVRNVLVRTGAGVGNIARATAIANRAVSPAGTKSAVEQTVKKEITKTVKEGEPQEAYNAMQKGIEYATPDEILLVNRKIVEMPGGRAYSKRLTEAANARTDAERKKILFGLQQDPAFRSLLKKSMK